MLKKLWNRIFGRQKNKETEDLGPEIVVPDTDILCTLDFTLRASGEVHVDLQWIDDTVEEFGLVVGELLYKAGSGKFKTQIQKYLTEYYHKKPESKAFILSILTYWDICDLEDKKEDEELPLISPLTVFSNSQLPNI